MALVRRRIAARVQRFPIVEIAYPQCLINRCRRQRPADRIGRRPEHSKLDRERSHETLRHRLHQRGIRAFRRAVPRPSSSAGRGSRRAGCAADGPPPASGSLRPKRVVKGACFKAEGLSFRRRGEISSEILTLRRALRTTGCAL